MNSLLKKTIDAIQPLDAVAMEEAQKALDFLLKPQGSLGKLEDIARQMAGITGKVKNKVDKKAMMVMCSDNGVADEGVASFPRDISMLVSDCMMRGLSGVAVLARHAGADLFVVDLGLEKDPATPGLINRKIRRMTSNFAQVPAMTREEAILALEIGIEETLKVIDKGYNLLGTGEVGIANTTTSSAILHVLTGEGLNVVVGRGAGLSDEGLDRKKEAIRRGVELHKPDASDPIDVLAKVGGFDIAGMAGTYLAAASRRVPVVIDGFISGVAALVACRLCPDAKTYMIPSHGSAEPGARIIFNELGMEPMLMMNMRLGEGTGCALAFHLIDASMYMLNNQGTFADIGMA
jgi:nicotinate-nucleotide--dimethylbenzimidazole phosphoribosyltransferase